MKDQVSKTAHEKINAYKIFKGLVKNLKNKAPKSSGSTTESVERYIISVSNTLTI
jgi:hypothetical protein